MDKPWFHIYGAVYLLFVREGKLLMLRRTNTGYEDGKFSLVAGKLDGGEEVKQAAIREAEEEIGIRLHPDNLEVVLVMHRMSDSGEWVDFFSTRQRMGRRTVQQRAGEMLGDGMVSA